MAMQESFPTSGLDRAGAPAAPTLRGDVLRVLALLLLNLAVGFAIMQFAADAPADGMVESDASGSAGVPDWHGNVARSDRTM